MIIAAVTYYILLAGTANDFCSALNAARPRTTALAVSPGRYY